MALQVRAALVRVFVAFLLPKGWYLHRPSSPSRFLPYPVDSGLLFCHFAEVLRRRQHVFGHEVRVAHGGLQVGVSQPFLDDQGVLPGLREAGGAGVAQHVRNELGVVFAPHLDSQLVPQPPEPFRAAFGEELARASHQFHAVFDDGPDGVYDGDGAGVAVLGLPEGDRAELKVDVAAFQPPELPAAAARIEQDEERLSVIPIAELVDDAQGLALLLKGEEADPVASFRAARHLGEPFERAPFVGRGHHARQRGELAVDGAARVALPGKILHVGVDPVRVDFVQTGARAKERAGFLGVADSPFASPLVVIPVQGGGAFKGRLKRPCAAPLAVGHARREPLVGPAASGGKARFLAGDALFECFQQPFPESQGFLQRVRVAGLALVVDADVHRKFAVGQ